MTLADKAREALQAERDEALSHIKVLEKALDWYGENARLARLIHAEGDLGRYNLAHDGGDRARQALSQSPTTSLAEHDKRVRAETLEEAAKVAEWAHMVPPDGGSPTEEECRVAQAAGANIRDLATSHPKEGQ
jgi:hypothetical protein